MRFSSHIPTLGFVLTPVLTLGCLTRVDARAQGVAQVRHEEAPASVARAKELIAARSAQYGFDVRRVAVTLFQQREDNAALAVLEALEASPQHAIDVPDCHRMRAMIARRRGDLALAESELRKAVEILDAALKPSAPQSSTIRRFAATTLVDLGEVLQSTPAKREEAIQVFKRVSELADAASITDLQAAAVRRSQLLADQNRNDQAAGVLGELLGFDAAKSLSPSDRLDLQLARAGLLRRAGDTKNAGGEYGAIFRDPAFAADHRSLAAGTQHAALLSLPDHAAERERIARDVLRRIAEFRRNTPASAHTMSPELFDRLLASEEQSALVIIRDTDAFAQSAR